MKAIENIKLARILKDQDGVVSLEQAYAAGVPDHQVRTMLGNHTWEKIGRGVFRLAGTKPSWNQLAWAACLETGGVASHRTAAWLHRLDGIGRDPPKNLEVLVALANQRKSKGVKVRRSRTLRETHIWKGKGIPRTNLARTLIDLSEVLGAEDYSIAFDSGLRRQKDLRQWIKRLIARWPTHGHRGVAQLSRMLDETHTAVDSALEDKLRRLLKKAKLPDPIAGYDVEDDLGGFIAHVDFAWPRNDPQVALMAHGARFHANTEQWRRDEKQVRRMNAMGWRVLPLTMEDVTRGAEELVHDIRLALAGYQQPPPPKVVVYE